MEKSVNLKKKIGQMFMCGFDALEINDHAKNLIENYYLGNVILFSRNLESYEQVKKLNESLTIKIAETTGFNPLISIDEEGGSVSRLRHILGEFLGHYAIGSLNDETLAYEVGKNIGQKLSTLGINMNLAPVADINSNPENIGIGIRSFGSDTELVKRNAIFMAKGYERSNVLPTLKHFPGLGDVSVDSHHDLPILKKNLEELKNQELIPFYYGIEKGIESIMVSHIIVKSLDEEYPASMSKRIISDFLKGEMGYKGLVMTDCFEMGAIQKNYGIGDAVVIAINAGVDIFDISHSEEEQVKAIEAVYKAVEDGVITEDRINESYYKIIKKKAENINKSFVDGKVDLKNMYLSVLENNDVDFDKLEKLNTICFGVNHFSSNPAEDVINNPVNVTDVFEKISGVKSLGFHKEITLEEVNNIKNEAEGYKNIILFVGDIDIYPQQQILLKELSHKNIYLIDMRLKINRLEISPKFYFNAFSYTDATVDILCEYLCDKFFV